MGMALVSFVIYTLVYLYRAPEVVDDPLILGVDSSFVHSWQRFQSVN